MFFILLTAAQSFAQEAAVVRSKVSDFLASLPAEQLSQALIAMEDSARTAWTNLPLGLAARAGLRYGDLSEESKIAFHKVLSSIFSSQGYLKTFAIMQVDDILHELFEIQFQQGKVPERSMEFIRKLNWDYGNYYVAIAGNPQNEAVWGLKF